MTTTVQEPEALLGVTRSAMGYRWQLRPVDERALMAVTQRTGCPEILARVLIGRGVDVDEAEDFLAPTLRNMLPDPSHLLDMDKAAARLADAVQAGETQFMKLSQRLAGVVRVVKSFSYFN